MKHKIAITLIVLGMFLATQLIGLYVVNHYNQEENKLPYGMEPPEEINPAKAFPSIITAFVIAILLFILLIKFRVEVILKLWFFLVIILALSISISSFLPGWKYASIIAAAIALPFALIKVFNRNIFVHNGTELLIYPGIAAVFIPLLNVWTTAILLVLISAYDMWAVWKSKIMQKMAKYQINTLKIFSGFFIPYLSKEEREKIRKMKQKYKKSELKKAGIKVNVAILGGGDIIFPIIAAGVMMKSFSGLWPALFVVLGALLGLGYLMVFAEKKKFYPAMPFITAGIFLGMLAGLAL